MAHHDGMLYYNDDEDTDMDEDYNSDEDADDDDEDAYMYDDDDGDSGIIMNDPNPKSQNNPSVTTTTLSHTDLQTRMAADVRDTSDFLGQDMDSAALVLRHFGWSKERAVEAFMDRPDGVLVKSGAALAKKPKPPRRTTTIICPICFDDTLPASAFSALSCGHIACSNCWLGYISAKITEEADPRVPCMAEGCTLFCPDTFIVGVTDAEGQGLTERFRDLLIKEYVAARVDLKFCPHPGCENTVQCHEATDAPTVVMLSRTIVPIVSCDPSLSDSSSSSPSSTGGMHHPFCFACPISSDHRPLICPIAKLWLKKCQDDSETANWITSNTKECGKCASTIEKNGGCNHMTCKKCKWEFCWVCMGPWSEHGTAWYSCNRFDEKAGVEARDAQSRSRASLERYLHYYNRWANHEQSSKLTLDLYAKTEKKMEEMQVTSSLTWIEVQFMKRGVEHLMKCRQTLMWTYAMAYYLARSNEKELFEDNQRDLERSVEELSGLLEGPLEVDEERTVNDMVAELRMKVTDKSVYVMKRNEIMLQDTVKGFLEGRWRWNVKVEGLEFREGEGAD